MNNEYTIKSLLTPMNTINNRFTFATRIISMMNEYDLSMKDAMLWDMEGFSDAPGANEMDFAYELDYYFWLNGLQLDETTLYREIMSGNHNDYVLTQPVK